MSDSVGLTANVDAPLDDIIEALTDFEAFPEWQALVVECDVQERDAEGHGALVRMKVDAKISTVDFVVRYHYDLPHSLGWDLVSGDLKENTGVYTFRPGPDGTTDVTVDIRAEPAFWIPGAMKRLIRDQSIKNSIRDLRRRVGG